MFRKLIATRNDYAALVVRAALALVMFPHGAQKLLGWFGGYGPAGTVGYFQQALGVPPAMTWLVILAESLGAVALLAGFFGRFMSFGIAATMVGAVLMVHGHNGFFMNWGGKAPGEGYEYHLLAIAMAVAVMIRGSGALSVDLALQRRLGNRDVAVDEPGAVPAVAA
jgi:putative oxidoreductase